MQRLFIGILRAGIGLAILIGLYGQIIVIPTSAADAVGQFPPYAPYAVPYIIVAILGVACVQAALAATWMLLGLVRRDAIFTARAFRWLDVITGASITATLLALGVAAHLTLADIPSPGDGMQIIAAAGGALAGAATGAAFAMLMAIIRGLFRKATGLRTATA